VIVPVDGISQARALQAESDDLEKLVLRFCIRPHMRALASSYFIPNSHLI
jgi:hypothetical protein